MSRILDAVLGNAYGSQTPGMNLQYGAQQGVLPKIGKLGNDGKYYREWISNHAYVSRNLIPVVLQYPLMLNLLPDPENWIRAGIAIMEEHPKSIDGLNSTINVEFETHPIGMSNEEQSEITRTTREKSSPSFTYTEKAGKSIMKFFDTIIRYGMMDPDTQKPLIASGTDFMNAFNGDMGRMYTPEQYTWTMMFIEPDITHRVALDAWITTNMMPNTSGERTGKRDIRSAGELKEYTIEFTGITMNNSSVIHYAQTILDKLTRIHQIPDIAINGYAADYSNGIILPTDKIDPTIDNSSNIFGGNPNA